MKISKLTRYYRYSKTDKRKIIRIFFLIIRHRLLVNQIPFKKYKSRIIRSDYPQIELSPFRSDISLINKVINVFPWRITCLMECLIVQSYFRKYSINIPIYIGVQAGVNLRAHAWYDKRFKHNFHQLLL